MRIDRVKLITEMARKNIKAKELSDLSGISPATITAVRGGKACSQNTAVQIARVLGVDVHDLEEASAP